MKKIIVLAAVAAMLPVSLMAQTAPDGGLSPEVLSRISKVTPERLMTRLCVTRWQEVLSMSWLPMPRTPP